MNALRINSESPLLVTTIGDLVVAVVDAALEVVENEKNAYRIADLVLNNILKRSNGNLFLQDRPFGGRIVREA